MSTGTQIGGMQQAIGQSGVVSVACTQLAGGRWDAHVSTNTRLRLWAQGSDSGQRLDGVRHPEGHEAIFTVSVEIVRLMEKTKGGTWLDDVRGAKGMV